MTDSPFSVTAIAREKIEVMAAGGSPPDKSLTGRGGASPPG